MMLSMLAILLVTSRNNQREMRSWHISIRIRSKLLISADNVEREIFWNEDVQEYITFKLHDEAREAIAIVAAHLHRPDLNMLDRMPDDPMHDVAYSEAGSKGYLLDAIVPFESSLIIPGNFTKVSMFDDPLGDKRLTCSTARLRNILGRLEKEYWGGAVHPSAWLEGGLVFARDAVFTSKSEISGWRSVNPNRLTACVEMPNSASPSILRCSDFRSAMAQRLPRLGSGEVGSCAHRLRQC